MDDVEAVLATYGVREVELEPDGRKSQTIGARYEDIRLIEERLEEVSRPIKLSCGNPTYDRPHSIGFGMQPDPWQDFYCSSGPEVGDDSEELPSPLQSYSWKSSKILPEGPEKSHGSTASEPARRSIFRSWWDKVRIRAVEYSTNMSKCKSSDICSS